MRDIVLVTVDSLRADHVGWHGYDRNTTPNLDQRAASAQTFTSAFSHACSTRPSFPSIMTSSYALEYGGFERLSSKRTTIAELLEEAGYETAGFHSNLYLSADFGYDRGFNRFFDSKSDPGTLAKLRQEVKTHLDSDGHLYGFLQQAFNATEKRAGIELGSAYIDAEEITDRALSWASSTSSNPRFLWVHYMDVHHPYVPPAEHQRRFRDEPVNDRDAVQLRRKMLESPEKITDQEFNTLIDLYDSEISYVDAQVERLIETLQAEWDNNPVIAFTADHGEEFLDHGGFSHSATFYDEVIHVPLFVDTGEDETVENDNLVGLMDLAPTLADKADVDRPETYRGQPLSQVEDQWNRSEVIAEWADTDTDDRRFAVRTTNWKYIREENGAEQLYDLTADPEEMNDLATGNPNVLSDLRETLEDHLATLDESREDLGDVEMDEEVRQRLRDLGYQE
ncbi:sulfatase [Halorubrum lacusprofundi]|uniref:Sulfatase n=1 Tax=Halorubrum lacusprofundi (strain ATCC 49239 / DSM 5036 / JCM 8891 / ACAM 34) TaxID=416348 RepID=B9LXA8_HALLT|nr:sulfatase [Halorubrum lacusprofundi]ACM59099.1 sulfatase [Halorubrum lacusprofundi ATCC 49239]MCG1005073.1 sulfatase-like hydrolase/transferase [Halorubrum lacusprofundi]